MLEFSGFYTCTLCLYVNTSTFKYQIVVGLVYVTNTTVKTKIRVKLGVSFHVNQSDSRSFRETSFHQ